MTGDTAMRAEVTRPAPSAHRGVRRCFWFAWCAAVCSVQPTWAQVTWDASPYRVCVWVALEPLPELTTAWTHEQSEMFQQAVGRDVGVAWQLQVSSAPANLGHDIRSGMERLSVDAVLPPDARGQQLDKLFLLAATCGWDGMDIQVRELDCQTRIWGPVLRRQLVQPRRLGLEAARAVIDAFAPLVRIDKVDEAAITVQPRAAYLTGVDNPRLTVVPGDLLRPVVRRDDRFGNPRPGGIEALTWTVLEVVSAPANTPDPHVVSCKLHSGVAQPLRSRRAYHVQQLALRIRQQTAATQLRLVSREDADRPLSGYDIYARDAEAARSTFLGRTDWRGTVNVQPGGKPLRTLYVRHGDELLARLPLVPGEQRVATAVLPDDAPRLEAEAFVAGLQEQLVDLMVRRTVLLERASQRLAAGNMDQAEAIIDQLRLLPTRDDLVRQLRNKRESFTSEDRRVRRKIDKLFDDLARRLQTHLDPREIDAVRDELAKARQSQPAPAGA